MLPDGVAALNAAFLRQVRPQGGGIAQPPGPEFKSHQGSECVLCRSAAGPAAADHLAQCAGRRQVRGGRCGHLVHPALHEGKCRFKAFEGGVLRRRALRLEDTAGKGGLDGLRIGRVNVAGGFLDLGNVDVDAAGVAFNGPEEVRGQPRRVGKQPGVRRFPNGKVQPDFLGRHVQAFAEGRHVGRKQGHGSGGERQPDVGGADDLLGKGADRLAQLDTEHRAAHVRQHGGGTAHHGLHLLGHLRGDGVGECLGNADRHGLGELAPGIHGGFNPFGARPGAAQRGDGGEVGGGVQPQPGQVQGLIHLAGRRGPGRGIAACRCHPACVVLGQLPVHRAVGRRAEHGLHLLENHGHGVGIRGQPGRLRQLGGVHAAGTAAAEQARKHFGQRILGVVPAVGWIGAHGIPPVLWKETNAYDARQVPTILPLRYRQGRTPVPHGRISFADGKARLRACAPARA